LLIRNDYVINLLQLIAIDIWLFSYLIISNYESVRLIIIDGYSVVHDIYEKDRYFIVFEY